jgi:hypothetical protein
MPPHPDGGLGIVFEYKLGAPAFLGDPGCLLGAFGQLGDDFGRQPRGQPDPACRQQIDIELFARRHGVDLELLAHPHADAGAVGIEPGNGNIFAQRGSDIGQNPLHGRVGHRYDQHAIVAFHRMLGQVEPVGKGQDQPGVILMPLCLEGDVFLRQRRSGPPHKHEKRQQDKSCSVPISINLASTFSCGRKHSACRPYSRAH